MEKEEKSFLLIKGPYDFWINANKMGGLHVKNYFGMKFVRSYIRTTQRKENKGKRKVDCSALLLKNLISSLLTILSQSFYYTACLLLFCCF